MKLYHSGEKIEKITADGQYGSFLFFLPEAGCSYGSQLFSLEQDETKLAEYSDIESAIFNGAEELTTLIEEVAEFYTVDTDEAGEILGGNETNVPCDYIAEMQVYQGRAAVALGFDGLRIEDEFSGETIMLDMMSRENDLVLNA